MTAGQLIGLTVYMVCSELQRYLLKRRVEKIERAFKEAEDALNEFVKGCP